MRNGRTLFACDLDNTLIHSYKHRTDGDVCVELLNGNEQSFISSSAYEKLQNIPETIDFCPVTTRSLEQFKRIRLIEKNLPENYAISSHGGLLLCDGVIDEKWLAETRKTCEPVQQKMQELLEKLSDMPDCSKERIVDGVLVFAVSENPRETVNMLSSENADDMEICHYGRKVYAFSKKINKGAAVSKLRKMLDAKRVICAGDSDMDITMLDISDLAIVPSKELASKLSCKNIAVYDEKSTFADFVLKLAFS